MQGIAILVKLCHLSILRPDTCATPFSMIPAPRSLICKFNANTYQFSSGLINARTGVFRDAEQSCRGW